MKRHERRPLSVRRPDRLWGIGRAGYALVLIALVLLAMLLTGYDARFVLMRLVTDTLGVEAMMFLVSHVIVPLGFDYQWLSDGMFMAPSPRFGLAPMCIVWVVLRVQPRPAGFWRYALVGLAGVGVPILEITGLACLKAVLGLDLFALSATGRIGWDGVLGVASLVLLVVAFPRPRQWPMVAMAGLLLAGWLLSYDVSLTLGGGGIGLADSIVGVEIHRWWVPLWLVLLLPWAVIQRRRVPLEGHCVGCGYSLVGLAGGACPECGRSGLG